MILLVSTGGTISGRVGAGGVYSARLAGADLLAVVRGALGDLPVRAVEFARGLSFEIGLAQWLELIRRLQGWNEDPGVEGIVVTQGTALLEEVPYLASLFLKPSKPVVFTGSMLPATVPGSDAARNLLDAFRVARDPQTARYGVVVSFHGRVIPPGRVWKRHKSHLGAVCALPPGPVGEVDARGVDWLCPPPRPAPAFARVALEESVHLLKATLGMDPRLLEAVLDLDPAGLVIEAFPGGGGLPVPVAERIQALAPRLPVVLCPRSPEGRLVPLAGGRSGGGRLLRGGAIPGGDLLPVRARLVLMASLAQVGRRGTEEAVAEVASLFASHASTKG